MEYLKYLKKINKATDKDKINDLKMKACMDDEISLAESMSINMEGNNRITELHKNKPK